MTPAIKNLTRFVIPDTKKNLIRFNAHYLPLLRVAGSQPGATQSGNLFRLLGRKNMSECRAVNLILRVGSRHGATLLCKEDGAAIKLETLRHAATRLWEFCHNLNGAISSAAEPPITRHSRVSTLATCKRAVRCAPLVVNSTYLILRLRSRRS